jgi:hypothetical protein
MVVSLGEDRLWLSRGTGLASPLPTKARPAAFAAEPMKRRAAHSSPVPTARTATLPTNDRGKACGRRVTAAGCLAAGNRTLRLCPQRRQKLSLDSYEVLQRLQRRVSTAAIIPAGLVQEAVALGPISCLIWM